MSEILTNSRAACFRACPRRHYLRYEIGLVADYDSLPRRVGAAFHRACEVADKGGDVDAEMAGIQDPYDLALVAAMFDAHQRRWGGASELFADGNIEAVAAEIEFNMPLRNPETGAPTPSFRLAGVIDRIVRLADGRLALMERKTTSQDFAPGSDYWTRLYLDQQLSIYVVAAREIGYDVETIIYDVTRRPALRPLKATPEDKRKFKKDGTLYANQRDRDETPEEYATRVGAWIAENTDRCFARIEIARLDQDLDDCMAGLWQQQQAIRAAQRAGHWYRNPGACHAPFKCDYLDICLSDLENQTPEGFVRVEDPHLELKEHAASGG